MLLLLFINSAFEMVGLAAFLPLFAIILQPFIIQNHRIISKVYGFLGFSSENAFILLLAGLIVVTIIVKNSASLLIIRSQIKFSLSLYQNFTNRLHQMYYSKGFAFFKNTNSNLIFRDVNTIPAAFANNMVLPMFNLLNEIFILLMILVSLLLYNATSVILLVCTVLPVFILFYRWVKERALKLERKVNTLNPKLSQSIFQSIHGYVDVEITNTQPHFRKQISKQIGQIVKLNIQRSLYNAMPTKVIETGMVIAIFVITAYGLFFLPDRAGLGALLGLLALSAYRILPSINRILIALVSIKSYQYTFDVISGLKDFKPDAIQHQPVEFNSQITVNNLSFRFPDAENDLLSHLNLTIKKGENIGIMGASGSGKTTFMNLLLGFWQPTQGTISIDNSLLTAATVQSWRTHIGYVQQDVYITDASAAENVAFGIEKDKIDMRRVEQSLRQASLWKHIQSLPDGVETNIGERGVRFSGGQRQRIGIARALYAGADVIFFDEATSALDSQTEMEITESIRSLADGKLTLVVIAHRETTLKYCSRIIKFHNGSIV